MCGLPLTPRNMDPTLQPDAVGLRRGLVFAQGLTSAGAEPQRGGWMLG